MVQSLLRAIALFCASSSFAFAQGAAPVGPTGSVDRDSQIEKLVSDWNKFRSAADTKALLELFHPEDRVTAAEFYASPRPAGTRAEVRGIEQAAGGRVNIRVERSRGGSRPGKTTETLQASAIDGQWFLRIPGGSLKVAAKPSTPAARTDKPVSAPNSAKGPETTPVTSAETKRFDNWTRICETSKVGSATCFLQASIVNASDKKPIMRWRVQVLEDKSVASVILIPAGVTLPPGLTLSLSKDKPTRVPFRTCNAQTCEVRFKMDADLVETVSIRTDVPVKFVNQAGGVVEFSVPMKGFGEGVSSIRAGAT